jgi:hypothetical protein
MAVSQLVLRLYKDQRLHTDPVPVVEGNEAKGKTGNLLFLLFLNIPIPATFYRSTGTETSVLHLMKILRISNRPLGHSYDKANAFINANEDRRDTKKSRFLIHRISSSFISVYGTGSRDGLDFC